MHNPIITSEFSSQHAKNAIQKPPNSLAVPLIEDFMDIPNPEYKNVTGIGPYSGISALQSMSSTLSILINTLALELHIGNFLTEDVNFVVLYYPLRGNLRN